MESVGDDYCETMSLDTLAALPEPCGGSWEDWSEQEYDLYDEIEAEMIWTMQVEMMNQELPVEDDGEFMEMFYATFEE
jgi:hypothetical protein